jgi:hypothetical protein
VFGAIPSGPVQVAVVDVSTGGSTVMSAALTYTVLVAPDEMTLVTAPAATVAVGAASSFAVRVTLGDGVTPVVGLPVAFSVRTGAAQFAGCVGSPCAVLTDASGLAASKVTTKAFGEVTLDAVVVGQTQAVSFDAVLRTVTAMLSTEYVAAGAMVGWNPQVSVTENGAPSMGARVAWTGSAGMMVAPAVSAASALGLAQTAAMAGPLKAGVQASGQACAWTNVCAGFAAVGVDPSAWRLVVVSGAGQTVAAGAGFLPVVLMVTDGRGDAVAGAGVSIYQTVDAAEKVCPVRGPCPIAPVLASLRVTTVSDANGLLSVLPMQLAGVGEVTNVAAATGTQGFVALSIDQAP